MLTRGANRKVHDGAAQVKEAQKFDGCCCSHHNMQIAETYVHEIERA